MTDSILEWQLRKSVELARKTKGKIDVKRPIIDRDKHYSLPPKRKREQPEEAFDEAGWLDSFFGFSDEEAGRIPRRPDPPYLPLRRDEPDSSSPRTMSPQQMGMIESAKVSGSSFSRVTPDGQEWIWAGRSWMRADAFDSDADGFFNPASYRR